MASVCAASDDAETAINRLRAMRHERTELSSGTIHYITPVTVFSGADPKSAADAPSPCRDEVANPALLPD